MKKRRKRRKKTGKWLVYLSILFGLLGVILIVGTAGAIENDVFCNALMTITLGLISLALGTFLFRVWKETYYLD